MATLRTGLLSRRRLLAAVPVLSASLLALPRIARAEAGLEVGLAEPEAEPSQTFYFPQTGHHLSGDFALAWEHIGGVDALGPPISELQMTWDREYQAFRNGVLFRDLDYPTYAARNAPVRPMLVGELWAGRRPESLDPENGDRRSAYWFYWTRKGVHPRFWQAFLDRGGAHAFGYPISNLVIEDGVPVQWFKRARLEIAGEGETERVVSTPLGEWTAKGLGANLERVPRLPDATTFTGVVRALPQGPVEERRIEVDLDRQEVFAYARDRLVFQAVTSTGLPQYHTPMGEFEIFRRVENERMIGGTPGVDYYDLSNVYYTQYFTSRGDALHYAYWHDNFGRVMSRGCVNLTLPDSRWLWGFADKGVPVRTFHSK